MVPSNSEVERFEILFQWWFPPNSLSTWLLKFNNKDFKICSTRLGCHIRVWIIVKCWYLLVFSFIVSVYIGVMKQIFACWLYFL